MRTVWKAFGIFLLFQVIGGILIYYFDSLIAEIAAVPLYILQVFLLIRLYRRTCDNTSYGCYTVKRVAVTVLFLAAFFLCYTIAESGLHAFFMPDYKQNIEFTVAVLINATIIGPISEEIMFRGFLFSHLNKKYTFLIANLIQASVFSAVHFDLYFFAFGLMFGVSLGILTRSLGLYSAILIHMLNNTVAAVLPENNVDVSRKLCLIIGSIFSILTAGMLWLLNKHNRTFSPVQQQE